tara:strand:- start:112 stop:1029 length:918 start_codon:yes stop_codon:yes gene_type:complete
MASHSGTKAVLAAMVANFGIALAKFAGFAITRSSAMLAEGVHSVADTSNQALLLFGSRRAKKPPTDEHPFGYGRERYFWSFVVALVLFTAGASFAAYEGIMKLRNPHEVNNVEWAVAILIFGLILETLSFRTAIIEGNRARGTMSWSQFIFRSREPELPVVLLEDAGALAGLLIALGAILTSHWTGDPKWDGIGTLTIGILLGIIALVLAREMHSLLIGEAAKGADLDAITIAIQKVDQVDRLAYLDTQHIGPEEILIGAQVIFKSELNSTETTTAMNEIEKNIRLAVPTAGKIFVKPVPSKLQE